MWTEHKLNQRNHWIFDMDGTLTVSAHDFEYMRRELGIASNTPILEALSEIPGEQAEPLWEALNQMEHHYASQASIMTGALELLDRLSQRGVQLAILTRNTLPVVEHTLEACGIAHFFPRQHIFDRDACEPKPSPDGINQLLRMWQADPADTVMVGDYLFDLQAGKEAGVITIHLDRKGVFAWPDFADIGCGTGLTCVFLIQQGYQYLDGIDLSPDMVRVAGDRNIYQKLMVADVNQPLDIADESYDAAVSSGTFTHGHVGPEPLDEIFRILKPGGILACTVHQDLWQKIGFEAKFKSLIETGSIECLALEKGQYYEKGEPEGWFCIYRKQLSSPP